MKLNVSERLNLLGVLPAEGNIVTLRVVRDLQRDLSFSEEEIKTFGFRPVDGSQGTIQWNASKNTIEKEVRVGQVAFNIVKMKLEALNKESKLTMQQVTLYEKFCDRKKDKEKKEATTPAEPEKSEA